MLKTKSSSRQNIFSYIDEAYSAFVRKKYYNASIILEKGYSSGDTNPYSLFLLAVSLIYSNNFSRANIILEHLQRIAALDHAEALFESGELQLVLPEVRALRREHVAAVAIAAITLRQ